MKAVSNKNIITFYNSVLGRFSSVILVRYNDLRSHSLYNLKCRLNQYDIGSIIIKNRLFNSIIQILPKYNKIKHVSVMLYSNNFCRMSKAIQDFKLDISLPFLNGNVISIDYVKKSLLLQSKAKHVKNITNIIVYISLLVVKILRSTLQRIINLLNKRTI